MKVIALALLFLAPAFAPAQALPFSLDAIVPSGEGDGAIPLVNMFPLTLSPFSFCLKDGRTAMVNAGGCFKAYDLLKKKVASSIAYPSTTKQSVDIEFFYISSSMRWCDAGFVSTDQSSLTALLDPSGRSISEYRVDVDDAIHGAFFTYRQVGSLAIGLDKEGFPYGILPSGEIVYPKDYLGLDRFLSRPFQRLPESARRIQADSLRDRHLIVDGLIYPATYAELKTYFREMGMKTDVETALGPVNHGKYNEPLGQSFSGDIYFDYDGIILVIDQCGQLLARLDMDAIDPKHEGEGLPPGQRGLERQGPFVAIHPNGDVYVLCAIEGKGNLIWKCERSWGIDCIALAREGLAEKPDMEKIALLESLSDQELKLVRNALFAFRGYQFKNVDLRNFFQGYAWYRPDPAVKSDPTLLNPAERRLLERVTAIEAKRERDWPQGGYAGYPREEGRMPR